MLVKTITCHDVYNHGASLQAYALQTYLSGLGHEVKIIDYKPDYLSGHYKLWTVSNPVFDKPIVKQAYLLAKLPGRLIALRRKRKFDEFTRDYLHLTSHRYHSNEELKANPPQADVYIAGSDQIWNTLFQNGRDAAFYLDFAQKTSKRIAYAASFATKDVVEEYRPFVRQMLHNFDAVSIRENISLPLLASLGRNDGVSVCDPVFLLSRDQWNALLPQENMCERYLLVYDCEKKSPLRSIVQRISREKGLKIYNVSNFTFSYADKNCSSASPLDFVRLIRDAEFVISNSFHATAFSIIFEKDFYVVNRSEGINERMKSILDELGLSDRLISADSEMLFSNVDYQKALPLLDEIVHSSKDFLNQSLGQC